MSLTTVTSSAAPSAEAMREEVKTYLQVQHAFEQCTPEIQAVVKDMIEIYRDCDATPEEKNRALYTIAEAIFSGSGVDAFGSSCESHESNRSAVVNEQMKSEEAYFAEKLASIMSNNGISQQILADFCGITQAAISNFLNQKCRPQKKTILKIASALNVTPETLWPGIIPDEPANA
jgi:lambda repressor-like predicted transcriptional regulator